ncbi:MAG: MBL fold metallo-hydrolase [Candidatus Latescibacteria bacterium]|nr:MBL fold metallo-hydrolase [Candidatus Latescibacterota bacterium]
MKRFPISAVAAAALLAGVAAGPAAAQDFGPLQFRTEELAPGVHLLQGAGGNVLACAGGGRLLLVDADYEQMADKLLAATAALESGPVALAVATHWHFDHVGGFGALAAAGAMLAAHESVPGWMASPQHLDVLDHDVPASPAAALPRICVGDTLTLRWGDETIGLRHVAGHTGGDLVVRLHRADVVHAGDLFFNCGYPYIDTAHGGSIDGMIRGLQYVLTLCGPATRVVPGHGPVATPTQMRVYLGILEEYRHIVATEKAGGATLAEIVAARPAASLDERWGEAMFPPEDFIEMIWLSVP